MSSETPVRLPVIDFSKQKLKPGSPESNLVKLQVREALEEYGCFEALFDQVLELRHAVFGAMEELFDLPLQTKSSMFQASYFEAILGTHQDCMKTWPLMMHIFLKTLNQTSLTSCGLKETKASGLEKTIRRMILETFGVEKYVDEFIDSTNYILKVMKYEGSQSSKPSIRAHSDQNLLTPLYQNEVNGLEIQNKDGKWINVKPLPNTFFVMTGESLSVWLNGGLRSTYHRVMMKVSKARCCVGMFATPRGGYQVKAPKELVDDKIGLLFKPFDCEEFLGFYSIHAARGDLELILRLIVVSKILQSIIYVKQ
ncbi:hypothetical protein PVK06_005511 [Gossypium arboreum]|uniref:Fe2OG dioxygenase domain-containing protein n=1 Tax=Gossypium arboreum TaxID=29729 RepID=A0ABR0QUZ9_GOSAR|nr:hypothetical protein PVK06_005511 [Gossypium arboreum]